MKQLFLSALLSGTAFAAVPPDIAKQLVNIGTGVCVPETAQIYGSLHPKPPYTGVKIERDISFGPDKQDVLDVFSAEKGGGNRPVLIYVSGGAGNKQQGGPNGEAFYDNIMLWATKNGMVGVNMQRHPGANWDDPAKAIGMIVQWVQTNISKYKGNPNRVFAWSQSAGNVPLSTYVGHSELWGAKGIGLKAVIFMSPPAFNILPATPPPTPGGVPACKNPDGTPSAGRGAGAPGGAGRGGAKGGDGKGAPGQADAKGGPGGGAPGGGAPGGGGRGKQAPIDPAVQLSRSNLPGLLKAKIPYMLSMAELDSPNIVAFVNTLKAELEKGGHAPTYAFYKDHSHISEVMSPDTADTSVTGPILKFMKGVK